jgi:regulator of RNase E activity RraA
MSTVPTVTAEELDLLRAVDTPTVCNVIELFDVRPRNTGYMDGSMKSCYPTLPPMVGYASTATFRSHSPPRGLDVYASLDEQLLAIQAIPGPRVVVFQDLDSPPAAATFGEVMCATYKAFNCAGIVTSGAGRDLEQVRALNFPAFVGSAICSHGYCHILHVNVPVHVGGITIHPGDLLHGDANGITTIPAAIASGVAHACKEFIDAEGELLTYLKEPKPTVEKYTEIRKRQVDRIKQLGERCRQKK